MEYLKTHKHYVILNFFWFFLLNIQNAISCQCIDSDTQISYLDVQRSDMVFIGRCINVKMDKNYRYLTFEIERNYKLNSKNKFINIITSSGGGDCGLLVKKAERWLILANLTCDGYYTTRCEKNKFNNEIKEDSLNIEYMTNIKNGKLNNKMLSNFKSKFEGNFENGKPTGHWFFYSENNKINILFKNGKIQTRTDYYYPNTNEKPIFSPTITTRYYENGNLKKIIRVGEKKVIGTVDIFKKNNKTLILGKEFDEINNRWIISSIRQSGTNCISKAYFGQNSKPFIENLNCQKGETLDIVKRFYGE